MLKYFDRAFFRFLFGFAGILSLGFAVLVIVGYYEVEIQGVSASEGALVAP